MPDHNPAVSLTGNLPAYQSFVNNAFLNEPGASETVDRLNRVTGGFPHRDVSNVPKNVNTEVGTDAKAGKILARNGEGREFAALGGVSVVGARLDQGAASDQGEPAVEGAAGARVAVLYEQAPGVLWNGDLHGVVIPTGADCSMRYDHESALFGYMCQKAGIPTGRPVTRAVADLADKAWAVQPCNQAERDRRDALLADAAALAAQTIILPAQVAA